MLVLAESKHQCVQDECQVGHQLCTSLLLQSGKGTGRERLKMGGGVKAMCENNYSKIWMHLNPSGEYVGNTNEEKKKISVNVL